MNSPSIIGGGGNSDSVSVIGWFLNNVEFADAALAPKGVTVSLHVMYIIVVPSEYTCLEPMRHDGLSILPEHSGNTLISSSSLLF